MQQNRKIYKIHCWWKWENLAQNKVHVTIFKKDVEDREREQNLYAWDNFGRKLKKWVTSVASRDGKLVGGRDKWETIFSTWLWKCLLKFKTQTPLYT